MSKVLVIGGAGYVGSSISFYLKDQGHEVWVLDDLSTGHRKFVQVPGFIQARAGDQEAVRKLCKREKFDCVMHFAAKCLVEESVRHPELYFENNVEQTEKLINVLLECGIKKFIFSSTCAVFGNPGDQPIHEDLPKKPINPYGESKLKAESLIHNFTVQKGLQAIVLRYFNAAGADPQARVGEIHEPETHLIPNIFKAVQTQTPVSIFGTDYPTRDGTCIRDYVHVFDLAKAHEAAMQKLLKLGEAGFYETYNLGTEVGFSLKEVLATTKDVLLESIPHEFKGRRAGDPPMLYANSEKAKKAFDFKINYALKDVIQTAWNWELEKEKPKKAIFLDRDGTINFDPGYLSQPDQLKLLPRAGEALFRLKKAGYLLIVVSNQSGVARGFIDPHTLINISYRMNELLSPYNVEINHFEMCVHKPEDKCECRKPGSGLILKAQEIFNIDLSQSYMVGDRETDFYASQNAKIKKFALVRTGDGIKTESLLESNKPSFIGDDLFDVANWILDQ